MSESWLVDGVPSPEAAKSLTMGQADELSMDQSALAGGMGYAQRNDGREFLSFNPNSGPEKVAFAGSVNEGMPMDQNKYLAAVDAVGLKWSGAADGYNNETVVEHALQEVWFDGAEDMFGQGVSAAQARGLIKDRLLEGMRRTHAFAAAEKDADLVRMEDILKAIDAKGWERDMKRFSSDSRLKRLYKEVKDGEYEFDGNAAANADLYNRFMGRGWQNGKPVEVTKWREQWWQETQGENEPPKDESGWNTVFRDNADEFALWYREHAERESANYSMRYKIAARTEILRRLGDARARGQELSYAQQRGIILSVLESKEGTDAKSPYDDAWHWPDVLTEEDVARMEERRMASIAERRKIYEMKASDAQKEIAGMREAAAKAKADAEAKKKAEEAAKKKADAEVKAAQSADEKERKALLSRQKNGTQKIIMSWGYDCQDNWNEPEGVRISSKKMVEVRKDLGWEEGDELFAVVKVRGKSSLIFPVIGDGYKSEDLGVALNARAQYAVTKEGKRGRVDFDAEGDGEVIFKIQKKNK